MGILEGQAVRIKSTGQAGKLMGIEWQDRLVNGVWHSKILAAVILDGAKKATVYDAADVGAP